MTKGFNYTEAQSQAIIDTLRDKGTADVVIHQLRKSWIMFRVEEVVLNDDTDSKRKQLERIHNHFVDLIREIDELESDGLAYGYLALSRVEDDSNLKQLNAVGSDFRSYLVDASEYAESWRNEVSSGVLSRQNKKRPDVDKLYRSVFSVWITFGRSGKVPYKLCNTRESGDFARFFRAAIEPILGSKSKSAIDAIIKKIREEGGVKKIEMGALFPPEGE